MKLWPVGQVRPIRFHHIRRTTASLLTMAGADLTAVQRVTRHTNPRITTEFYANLAPGPRAAAPLSEGRLAARVFYLFDHGRELREIVEELEVRPRLSETSGTSG